MSYKWVMGVKSGVKASQICGLAVGHIASLALIACGSGEASPEYGQLVVDASRSEPGSYATIQEAIDAAPVGATIVARPGVYSGPGNVELDFRGKAIALQSETPQSSACRKRTVIDASGHDSIARFDKDEGPKTVFRGFTLIGGTAQRAATVRGVPGFYSMSDRARPSITDMEVKPRDAGKRTLAVQSQIMGRPAAVAQSVLASALVQTEGASRWSGQDPFSQPVRTTRYHGSGDVDLDGDVDGADATLADAMAAGTRSPSTMADVDANGVVTAADAAAIRSVMTGGYLPGWWERLSTREERDSWLDRIVAIDPTNARPYTLPWFQCGGFAAQLHFRSCGWLGDAGDLVQDAGRTLFDIPIYQVSVSATDFGHAINAVLVGNDPHNFADWRFIEPQTDYSIVPGMWDMPIGSTLQLATLDSPQFGGSFGAQAWITFAVDDAGGHLQQMTDGMVTARPAPSQGTIDNDESFFNPRALPGGRLLYESQRRDLTRNTDVHLGLTSSVSAPAGQALAGLARDTHLLDAVTDASGTVHLLWKSTEPSVYYGQILAGQTQLTSQQIVFVSDQEIPRGRLVLTSAGQLHAFWYLRQSNSYSAYQSGIFWSRRAAEVWSTPQVVVQSTSGHQMTLYGSPSVLTEHNPSRNFFDVVERSGALELAYLDQASERELLRMRYNGAWSTPETVLTGAVQGLRLATDSRQNLHLVYWWDANYGSRGTLSHRIHNGSSWSASVDLDTAGASSPDLLTLPNGTVYLAWERQVSDRIVPVLRAYTSGWQAEQVLSSSASANVWYPTLTYDASVKALLVAWSERSGAAARLAVATVPVACVAQCTNRACGDDGCGGSCGSCNANQSCSSAGQCQAAPSCTDRIQNQGETGVDCGGPCPPCQTSACTCPSGCGSVVAASVPFTRDGIDNRCYYFGTKAGSFINSWNAASVNLNGVNITNRYVSAGSYPAPVGGGYYLYFRSTLPWGHVEVKN